MQEENKKEKDPGKKTSGDRARSRRRQRGAAAGGIAGSMHPAIRGYGLSLLVVIVCVGLLAWCGRQNGGQEPSTAAPPASESIGVLQTVEPVPESTAAPAETTAAPPETTAAPEETAPAVPPELLEEAQKEAHKEFEDYEEDLKRKAKEAEDFRKSWEEDSGWSEHDRKEKEARQSQKQDAREEKEARQSQKQDDPEEKEARQSRKKDGGRRIPTRSIRLRKIASARRMILSMTMRRQAPVRMAALRKNAARMIRQTPVKMAAMMRNAGRRTIRETAALRNLPQGN